MTLPPAEGIARGTGGRYIPHGCSPKSPVAREVRCRMRELQIAIDGPAASGKSTVARLVAEELGGFYINTGEMYRAVTHEALQAGLVAEHQPERVVDLLAELEFSHRIGEDRRPVLVVNGVDVDESTTRAPEVSGHVSYVAKIPAVRDWLVRRQQETRQLGIVVMEGRDIGTVVFPEAEFKFFVTASPEERARRRLAQAGETVAGSTLHSVAAEIAKRDRIDSSRKVAPLRAAEDAETIVTDDIPAVQVAATIVRKVRRKYPDL